MKKKIAIIGAGISGVTLARELVEHADISLFEKARGVSGRMSTRRAELFRFDHGAQYFTARSKAFKTFLKPLIAQQDVMLWEPRFTTLQQGKKPYKRDWFEPHYVAVPHMNSLIKKLAEPLDVRIGTEISALKAVGTQWQLQYKQGEDDTLYDWVISSAPAPQASNLLPECFAHHAAMNATIMSANYSLMLGFDAPLNLLWDAAVVKDSPIGWMAQNHTKPLRDDHIALLAQTTPEWADAHIDDDRVQVERILIDEVCVLTGIDTSDITHTALHGWRYAGTKKPAGEDFLLDAENKLAACGDWCIAGRVEAAFTSGYKLAESLKSIL